jgi:hypothetical protein
LKINKISTASSLFKPKIATNEKKPKSKKSNDDDGCQLSFETLKKRERYQNNHGYVARLSEIQNLNSSNSNSTSTSTSTSTSASNESTQIKESFSTSADSNSNKSNLKNYHPTISDISYLLSSASISDKTNNNNINKNYDSFTRVSSTSNSTSNMSELVLTLSKNNDATSLFTQRSLSESDLKIDNQKRDEHLKEKRKSRSNDDLVSDKIRADIKERVKSIRSLTRIDRREFFNSDKYTALSTQTNINNQKKQNNQNKKTFLFAHLNQSPDDIKKMEKIIKHINSKNKQNIFTKFCNQNSFVNGATHLIIDFDKTFIVNENNEGEEVEEKEENVNLSLDIKCSLLLASLCECLIVRREWLDHSRDEGQWLNEKEYLLTAYYSSDHSFSEYNQNDFDIKLVKLIKHKDTIINDKTKNVFKNYKNIFLIDTSINNNNTSCDSTVSDDFLNQNKTFSFFTGFMTNRSNYDNIIDLVTKCGGQVTSRHILAEIAVFIIDKNEQTLSQIESLTNDHKYDNLTIVSSDWIIGKRLFVFNKHFFNKFF